MLISTCRSALKFIKQLNNIWQNNQFYAITEVNTKNQLVTIQLSGRKIAKISLSELITEAEILSNLPPAEACWIGVIFGELLHKNTLLKIHKNKHAYFSMDKNIEPYQLRYQSRSGVIGYMDIYNLEEYEDHPFSLIKSNYVIGKFGPIQACYIGMLAGIEYSKKTHTDKKPIEQMIAANKSLKFNLRLV